MQEKSRKTIKITCVGEEQTKITKEGKLLVYGTVYYHPDVTAIFYPYSISPKGLNQQPMIIKCKMHTER